MSHQLEQVFVETLSTELTLAPKMEQKKLLADFLNAIKRFISTHTAFGSSFAGLYDYELLVASLSDDLTSPPYVDDFTFYPTGGRCHGTINARNIVYRVTFNSEEINLFKSILSQTHDEKIFAGNKPSCDLVASTARYSVCNQLAIEIICAKLVRFLNACGNLKHLIYLNQAELQDLFKIALELRKPDIQEIISQQHISVLLGRDYFANKDYRKAEGEVPLAISTHRKLNRYALPIYQKFAPHTLEIDKLRLMYFSLIDATHVLESTDCLHQKALDLLSAIKHFCAAEEFNVQNMALLKVHYYLFQHQLKKHEESPAIPRNPVSKSVTLSVLNGFLIALGAAAIAIAFAFLSNPILLSSVGLVSIAVGEIGFFQQKKTALDLSLCLSNPSFAV